MRSAYGFVGRQPELDQVLAAVGCGAPVLVVGEAGVGKTRLVHEVGDHLGEAGSLLWTAGCLPLARRLPLLPVVEILRQQHADANGTAFDSALSRCPVYVREELAPVLPELGPAPGQVTEDGWRQERLFAAVARVWRELASAQPMVVVIEDLHWSDQTTRDFLTYAMAHLRSVPIVLTSRTDEPEPDDGARGWLLETTRRPGLERVALGPLGRADVGDLVAGLTGLSPLADLVDDLFRRSEGNPFYLEQLVTSGSSEPGAALPGELSELLRARADTLAPTTRRILDLVAVAARPLAEEDLAVGLLQPAESVRASLRDLLAAQLVRRDGSAYAIRHSLVAEAVAGALLASERAQLHAAVAVALTRRHDARLAAEIALHWSRAGQAVRERRVRRTAARYAQTVFAHTEAAGHWERAFDLGETDDPAAADDALQAMAAWEAAGLATVGEAVGQRGAKVAARRGQQSVEAALAVRLAQLHGLTERDRGLRELTAAVQLFDKLEPSSEQVEALHLLFERHRADGHADVGRRYLEQAVELCRQASLPVETRVRPLTTLALEQLEAGQIGAGLATLDLAREGADPGLSPFAQGWLAVAEAYALRTMNRLEEATAAAQRGLEHLAAAGLDQTFVADLLAANLVDAWLGRGLVDQAGAWFDRVRDRALADDRDVLCASGVRVNTIRGRLAEAESLRERVLGLAIRPGLDMWAEFSRIQAELALWQGSAVEAVRLVEPIIEALLEARQESLSAPLFVLGMRGCADLAEAAAARRHDDALAAARTRARALQDRLQGAVANPFADHPFFVLAATEGSEWSAETGRAFRSAGADDQVGQWAEVAGRWMALRRPHRAAYARWRQTEALLRTGDRPAATVALQTGWRLAEQHAPLRARLAVPARLGRIEVAPAPAAAPPSAADSLATAFGLTARELDVLQLLGDGLTNAQIGARLYLSSKTASVHVTAILRKLGATNRVHAATIAERAGLLQLDRAEEHI